MMVSLVFLLAIVLSIGLFMLFSFLLYLWITRNDCKYDWGNVTPSYPVATGTSDKLQINCPAKALPEKYEDFPSIWADASVDITFLVPAYNEEKRLPPMLNSTLTYLHQRQTRDPDFTYEIIIIDDGSKDTTRQVAYGYISAYGSDKIRLMTLPRNGGKGTAVREGALRARGRALLMLDADGASEIAHMEKLEEAALPWDDVYLSIGSRAHLQDDAVADRTFLRNLLMHGFHFLVWSLCVRTVKDTQCGFKLYSRKAARFIFSNQRIARWSFDVEHLFLCERYGVPIIENAINWQEIDGSKVGMEAPAGMGRDLFRIRFSYLLGIWDVCNEDQIAC